MTSLGAGTFVRQSEKDGSGASYRPPLNMHSLQWMLIVRNSAIYTSEGVTVEI